MSHEFIILADTGESQVYCHKDLVDMEVPGEDIDFDSDLEPIIKKRTLLYAATDEQHNQAEFESKVPADKRLSARCIEVGHIFYFGSKYSAPMKAVVAGPDGDTRPVEMGSYGIGVSRLVAAIIEASHDDAGIIWPESVAPFDIALINLKPGDPRVDAACEDLYAKLKKAGKDVLFDDTNERPGAKFASMDLIGIPYQLVVGPRGLEKGLVEVKVRATGAREELSAQAALNRLTQ